MPVTGLSSQLASFLKKRGGSLTIRNPAGQPPYLLDLVARNETDEDAPPILLSDDEPDSSEQDHALPTTTAPTVIAR